ncbi:hypothetical protein [Tissierella praeacuta]|uniref:hypothetical protein n=1 Tax=Tissierella praeacuta TaxID=43131 RepID=UPI003340C065
MKKTIIGSVILLSGVIIDMTLIMAAAFYTPSMTAWSGLKLWYAIFGAKKYGNGVVESLFLGVPFVIGIMLIIIGLIILSVEYYNKEN